VSGFVDQELVALVNGQEHQSVGSRSSLALDVADIISAGQTAQFRVHDHALTPLPGCALQSPNSR
jgi:hypothetical protein